MEESLKNVTWSWLRDKMPKEITDDDFKIIKLITRLNKSGIRKLTLEQLAKAKWDKEDIKEEELNYLKEQLRKINKIYLKEQLPGTDITWEGKPAAIHISTFNSKGKEVAIVDIAGGVSGVVRAAKEEE